MPSDDDLKTRPYTSSEAGDFPDLSRELQAPARLGRYILLELMGAGGMGVVYCAYDPKLDRKVALKLLRPAGPGRSQEAWQGRLLREARAMARLSHPNVVHVHDVGEVGDQAFVAMERIDGQDLRRWMRQTPRPWQEVRDVLVQAGRGLAAAHRAGLVHRDFKPENVLIGSDGRVSVTDFGLAALSGPEPLETGLTPAPLPKGPLPAIVGTPEYVAPEQLLGAPSDPRADQFSFCVTLYEALYGDRPYEGDNAAQCATAATRGELRKAPEGTRVPSWLRQIVAQGLSADPAARHASMDALLALLQPNVPTRKKRWLRISVSVAVASFAFVTLWNWNQERLAHSCDGGQTRFIGVWDGPARDRIRAAFLATGVEGAAELSARVEANLDRYVTGWLATRREVCEATRVRRQHPEPVMTTRFACLERRATELHALTRLFALADGAMVLKAAQAVEDLEGTGTCAALIQETTAAPAVDPAATELATRLAEAKALQKAGRYLDALSKAREIPQAARKSGQLTIAAEAALLDCETQLMLDQSDRPLDGPCLDAALLAEEAGQPDRAAFAWTQLVMLATNHGEHEQARRWLRIAQTMVARLGPENLEAQARLANAEGFAAFGAGRYADAVSAWEAGVAIRDRALPEQTWDRAAVLTNLGIALMRKGDHDAAVAALERGLSLHRGVLGDDHPELASILGTLAMARLNRGEVAMSRELFQRSISLRRRARGPDANVSLELSNLATIDLDRGEFQAALQNFEEAQRLREAFLGADHPFVAASLLSRAHAHRALGQWKLAVPLATRALAIREKKYGVEHPLTGEALRTVGLIQLAGGNTQASLASARRAVSIAETAAGPNHASTATAQTVLAEALLVSGDSGAARRTAQAAVSTLEQQPSKPAVRARAQTVLARALLAEGANEDAHRAAVAADALYATFALRDHPDWVEARQLVARSKPQ